MLLMLLLRQSPFLVPPGAKTAAPASWVEAACRLAVVVAVATAVVAPVAVAVAWELAAAVA